MKSHRFFEFFPPPVFLTMPTVGISIEGDVLRFVSFGKKHHRTILKNVEEFKLEPETVVAGQVSKPDKVISVLKNIRSKYGVRFVRLALPEEKAYVYETVIPMPETGEMSDAVEFSLDQNIPLSAAEAVFGFAVVEGPFSVAEVQSVRVVVSAYPKEVVEGWIDVFKKSGMAPLSLTPESQAIAHSLVVPGDTRASMLVHFMKDKTIVAVVSGGYVRFSTVVSGSADTAEKTRVSHQDEKISESIELLAVREEVKKVFSYWMSKEGVKSAKEPRAIKTLIVTGHISDMLDVAEYLGKHIGIPATLGNVWQNAFSLNDFIPDIEFEDSLRLAATIGVALPK